MNFKIFLLIFALPIFLSKYFPIFSDISVKSKYRYICNYRYFVPWLQSKAPFAKGREEGDGLSRAFDYVKEGIRGLDNQGFQGLL